MTVFSAFRQSSNAQAGADLRFQPFYDQVEGERRARFNYVLFCLFPQSVVSRGIEKIVASASKIVNIRVSWGIGSDLLADTTINKASVKHQPHMISFDRVINTYLAISGLSSEEKASNNVHVSLHTTVAGGYTALYGTAMPPMKYWEL